MSASAYGGLELLDTITVSGADTQEVEFGENGDGDQLRALDGDADKEYILLCRIKHGNFSGLNYDLYPNGETTNAKGGQSTLQNGFSSGSTLFNEILRTNSTAVQSDARVEIMAATGRPRLFHSQGISTTGACYLWTAWSDKLANITSLVVHCRDGAHIKVGSVFTLYRRGVWL